MLKLLFDCISLYETIWREANCHCSSVFSLYRPSLIFLSLSKTFNLTYRGLSLVCPVSSIPVDSYRQNMQLTIQDLRNVSREYSCKFYPSLRNDLSSCYSHAPTRPQLTPIRPRINFYCSIFSTRPFNTGQIK